MSLAPICIVIPCYNEAKRLDIELFDRFAKDHPHIHICFANDGSTDQTLEMLQSFSQRRPDQILLLHYTENTGKAETIRKSLLHLSNLNTYTHIAYLDADLSAPLSEMLRLYDMAQKYPEAILVMGCRLRRLGASVTRSNLRHYLGRIFATLASMSLRLPVYDTQCGAKLLRNDYIPVLMQNPFISKWFFDIEILKRLLAAQGFKLQAKSIIEVPLWIWHAKDGSKVKLRDFLIAPVNLWRIHWHYPRPKVNYDELNA